MYAHALSNIVSKSSFPTVEACCPHAFHFHPPGRQAAAARDGHSLDRSCLSAETRAQSPSRGLLAARSDVSPNPTKILPCPFFSPASAVRGRPG